MLDTTYISPMLLPVSTGQMYLLNCDIFHVHCLSSRYSIVSNISAVLTAPANRRPVSSVGRVPDYRAGGRGFKHRPDQHSGSLNN